MYKLIDSHAHLDELDDRDAAVREAEQAGLVAIVAVGQDYESNVRVLELADKHSSLVYPALGLHPWSLGQMDSAQVDLNLRFIEENVGLAVGIGEVGMDYHKRVKAAAGKERQKEVFRAVLEIARRHDKAVSIHSRYSWKDCFDLVRDSGVRKAVFHWYTGFSSVLREIIAEGLYISATPAAEYHEEHRRAIKECPLDTLLLETDTPVTYGREAKFQARPADVVRSLEAVALLKGLDRDVVAQQTTANASRLFGLEER